MNDTTYNGAKNWATWFVSAHIENVEDWYREAMRQAERDRTNRALREYVEGLFFEPVDPFTHHSDQSTQTYMQDHMSREEFANVDWDEVRESLLPDER